MKIYNFDRVTGAFLGESVAEESPMEPGTHLIPAFATAVRPPNAPAGSIAVFKHAKGVWAIEALAAPAPAAAAPSVTFDMKAAVWRAEVKAHADVVARAFDFDDMAEAVTYADEPAVPKFQMQGAALRSWRSQLWHAFDELCAVAAAGKVKEPSNSAELIGMLPAFEAPDTSRIGIPVVGEDAESQAVEQPAEPQP